MILKLRKNRTALFAIVACVLIILILYTRLYYYFTFIFHSSKNSNNLSSSSLLTQTNKNPIRVKDWHDYVGIKMDLLRTGPGEQGKAYFIKDEQRHKAEIDALYAVNAFNGYLSDFISVNRSLPDLRHPNCRDEKYAEKLPTVSVVIPFHNEHWSTLLRSVYSILNRSPPQLIHEIILVDDGSDKPFLKKQLDNFVAKNLPKVRVLRDPVRHGLISARLIGARNATGEVLLFLDSHVEANVNWLPPLLDPIAINASVVVCPFIDVIAFDTFEYRLQDSGARGSFDWSLYYKRLPLFLSALLNPSKPFESPVMAGGLFAINRKYFWHLGGYDPGLKIWGGEQYELSFKIWQCGGKMVDAPCSHVGHIYRKLGISPFKSVPGHYLFSNYKRVAEVWMDNYAKYIYSRNPIYNTISTGDLTNQKALRQKLDCKSFDWFMKVIAFDQLETYPPEEPKEFASGQIKVFKKDICISLRKTTLKLFLESCDASDSNDGIVQDFIFTGRQEIKPLDDGENLGCFDSNDKKPPIMFPCHLQRGNQEWKYFLKTHHLYHEYSHMCLEFEDSDKSLFLNHCEFNNLHQKWKFSKTNANLLKKFFHN